MRKLSFLIGIISLPIILKSQRSVDITLSDGAPLSYVPVSAPDCSGFSNDLNFAWGDEFNGSTLDLTKWKLGWPWNITYGDSPSKTAPEQPVGWADINEISFTGSSIKLGLNYNPNNIPDGSGGFFYRPYSCGVISSLEQFDYGYYEIRCKIPQIAKHHPAFWLFGACGQEIDVFEFVGVENKSSSSVPFSNPLWNCSPHRNKWYIPQECASSNPIFTYHVFGSETDAPCSLNTSADFRVLGKTLKFSEWNVDHTIGDPSLGCEYSWTSDVNYHNDWHTFGMKFSPEGITWYIDGIAKLTEYKYIFQIPTPFGTGNFPIINMETFCKSNSPYQVFEQVNMPTKNIKMNVILENFRDSESGFPNYNLFDFVNIWYNWPEGFLEIDYFRYYKLSECNKDLSFCNNPQLNNYYNSVKAKNITLSDACTINTPTLKTLDLKALEEIKILSEFNMDNTSEFSAEIKNCVDGSILRTYNTPIDSSALISYYNNRTSNHIKNKTINNVFYDFNNEFIVYPSPSNGGITIHTLNQSEKTINVLNNLGVIIYTQKFNSENFKLNLNVAPGIYYVEIDTDGLKNQKKIIIEH